MFVHEFKQSKSVGDIGEQMLEQYLFSNGFDYIKVSISNQIKYAIDYIAIKLNRKYLFEVKTDAKSEKTGNLFIETEVNTKPGWFRKYSLASKVILVLALPYLQQLWFTNMSNILTLNLSEYKSKTVCNINYNATGHIVPMRDIKEKFRIVEM